MKLRRRLMTKSLILYLIAQEIGVAASQASDSERINDIANVFPLMFSWLQLWFRLYDAYGSEE